MRDAAFEIALRRDDWAPSLGRRIADAVATVLVDLVGRGLAGLLGTLRRRRRIAADRVVLRTMDATRLADIGLADRWARPER